MPLTLIDREGLLCPVFVCDHCGEPIHAPASGRDADRGHVLYVPGPFPGPWRTGPLFYVHQRCDRAFEQAQDPEAHFWWRELKEFLPQLAYNTEYGFDHAGVS